MRQFRLPLALLALVAIAACGSGKSGSNAGSNGASNAGSSSGAGSSMGSQGGQAAANMPDCGAVQPVWVNLRTKKYHEQGDPAYGHTKHGEYLCPSQARQQGFVAAGGARAHHRHRRHRYASGGNAQSGGNQSNGDTQDDNSDATSNP